MLRRSFLRIEKQSGIVALAFYRNLFTLAPQLRSLFQSDIELQGCKFMEAVGFAIRSLKKPGELTPMFKALGRRHTGYGAVGEHYPVVIEALLLTLQQSLGPEFTPRLARAWERALIHIAEIMKSGAASAVALS
jgi:hemoglobin-like flavoprotein